MYTLRLKHHFDAAHHLENYKGACAAIHGHTFFVEVEIKSEKLIGDMVYDFKDIKDEINKLDHKNLNEVLNFNPTAENIAKYLYNQINLPIFDSVKITVWESPDCSITYEN